LKETEWVEYVAETAGAGLADADQSLEINTQVKIPYSCEIRACREVPETEAISFATDFIVIEDYPKGCWKPRAVVEAKVGGDTTQYAITYRHKAANHRSVFPYLRYDMMLGKRQHYPLPGRLYRHGTQFDFMISFKEHQLSTQERKAFRDLLLEEVYASRALENMIYESRKRDRDHHTLFHRRLTLDDARRGVRRTRCGGRASGGERPAPERALLSSSEVCLRVGQR
jgi:hypothetical protein